MLHYETVSPQLISYLNTLMSAKEFECFRLVGGTALSLQLGHRVSVDIDMFTDATYGSVDFNTLKEYLKYTFGYVDHFSLDNPAIGMSFSVGNDEESAVKVDLYYTDTYIRPA
ncbi:MAG: nucleotidyl transferase AbiEii/AbiGii toxin family protein [Flavipsychrobacter sp.]|nr:nucleotidyl transferase AbiEii/AbiGii toxin family protein [Flavipsychrobacter sp.]